MEAAAASTAAATLTTNTTHTQPHARTRHHTHTNTHTPGWVTLAFRPLARSHSGVRESAIGIGLPFGGCLCHIVVDGSLGEWESERERAVRWRPSCSHAHRRRRQLGSERACVGKAVRRRRAVQRSLSSLTTGHWVLFVAQRALW